MMAHRSASLFLPCRLSAASALRQRVLFSSTTSKCGAAPRAVAVQTMDVSKETPVAAPFFPSVSLPSPASRPQARPLPSLRYAPLSRFDMTPRSTCACASATFPGRCRGTAGSLGCASSTPTSRTSGPPTPHRRRFWWGAVPEILSRWPCCPSPTPPRASETTEEHTWPSGSAGKNGSGREQSCPHWSERGERRTTRRTTTITEVVGK